VPLRYFTPFAFLAIVPLGAWLGGAWTFMPAAATPLGLAGLDALLGDEPADAGRSATMSRGIPRLYILLHLAVIAWVAGWVMRPQTHLLDAVGLAASVGVITGVFGFVAAHEMIHSRNPRDRGLGLVALGSVFYMHFRIAHIYGHHRRAATFDDPASARLGEGLYRFLVRSITGQVREAWAFEVARLRQRGRRPVNRMIVYAVVETAFLVALMIVSWKATAFIVAVAFIAVGLLETFNYVAHYGLSRTIHDDGRVQRLAPQHSWNTGRRMNNAALFNMGRHSDHHRYPVRPFARLKWLAGETTLPFGYAEAMLTALVPPVWHHIMDKRADALARKPEPARPLI
jgi:alkane 1-monooxygenase